MSRKTSVPMRIAPLQRVIAIPITNPAEQAALDKVRRREKQRGRARSRVRGKAAAKKE